MPSAVNPAPWIRQCILRPGGGNVFIRPRIIGVNKAAAGRRSYAETNRPDKLPEAPKSEAGPNMQQQPHVSEEAAQMAKIQGQEGPDMEQGTPVQEILQEEKEALEDAPQVLQDQVKSGQGAANTHPSTSTGGTRSFSTMARRRMDLQSTSTQPPFDPSIINSSLQQQSNSSIPSTTSTSPPGLKFPPPPTPAPTLKNRHPEIILQLTNLMMRDGKKSVAERNMSTILTVLRTSPAPTYSSTRTLLPGAPPASYLPLNPIMYLTLAIDSVSPLLRIRSQRGAAGGGVALQIPVPLGIRQRRRQAFQWILDASDKRRNTSPFAERVAQEIIAVVEGRSGCWEKRAAVHRLGTTARTGLNFGRGRGRR